MNKWRWKYFTRDELKCKATGELVINEDALDKLELMREIMGASLKINSAYRSPAHNKKIGGAKNSMHVQGRAFDVSNKGHNPVALYQAALQAGFTGFGFYRTFLHVDTGKRRSWGGYSKMYLDNTVTTPPKALSVDKETEKPHKIEGVRLSDKQKVATAATTATLATGGVISAVDPNLVLEHAPAILSFLQNADFRVALVVLLLSVIGLLILRQKNY
jgi:hypothetical protein